jgi:hypothetical protein
MATQRNAQAFILGSGTKITGTSVSLTCTSALPLILDDMTVGFSGEDYPCSTVSSITLSGQSLMASNKDMPLASFATNALVDDQRNIGLTIDTNQIFSATVEVSKAGGLTADNPISLQVSTSPTDVVISPNNAPSGLLNYVFGMGKISVPGASVATLQATSLRDGVFLGRLIADFEFDPLAISKDPNLLTVRSVLVDGIELLSSQRSGTAEGAISLETLANIASDKLGNSADYLIGQNSIVSIVVHNASAQPCDVALGFFCRPLV